MKLLITGSSGYIGSVLCKMAQEQGHFVLGTDTTPPDHGYCDEFIHDSIDRNFVAHESSILKIDAVFHLAASADVTHSTIRPMLYYHNNVGSTSALFDNLVNSGWNGPVIFSSTAAVYGYSKTACKETQKLLPETAYGKSKLMCEQLLSDLWVYNKIPSVSFRYFNVAGAYNDVGDHPQSGHVIQKLCYSTFHNTPFRIFGNKYDTKDGTCVRDYIHVLDVARAHFTALDYVNKNQGPKIFNLGTNSGFSVQEIADKFVSITGKKIDVIMDNPRAGDPPFLVANPFEFINTTKFNYEHSTIDNIIESAWKWYRRIHNAV